MPRRYSEEEAQRIFALVADRQRATTGVEGLSLSELEEAAQAAGLDPGLVAIAAASASASSSGPLGAGALWMWRTVLLRPKL